VSIITAGSMAQCLAPVIPVMVQSKSRNSNFSEVWPQMPPLWKGDIHFQNSRKYCPLDTQMSPFPGNVLFQKACLHKTYFLPSQQSESKD
jgi:hypothetical protein